MNVLVTAASKYGATAGIAEMIAAELMHCGVVATVLAPDDVRSVDEYDGVIIGSGVYVGHWLKPATELVERHAAALRQRRVWLFSSGPIGDPPMPKETVDVGHIVAATGAVEHRTFGGELVKKRLNFVERALVGALRAPEGDFRDPAAIAAWARDIARALGADDAPALAERVARRDAADR